MSHLQICVPVWWHPTAPTRLMDAQISEQGIISKRRDLPYRSGRVKSWIKVKNPTSPAVLRIVEEGAR